MKKKKQLKKRMRWMVYLDNDAQLIQDIQTWMKENFVDKNGTAIKIMLKRYLSKENAESLGVVEPGAEL